MTERPGLARSALHLAGLWALAVAMPQFSFLSGGEALVLFGWEPLDIAGYAIALLLVPPALLAGLEALVRAVAGEGWRWRLHVVLIGVLVAVLAGVLIQGIDREISPYLFVLALVAGAAGALAYALTGAARSLASFLAFAPPIALVSFVAGSGVFPLVFPAGGDEAEASQRSARPPVVLVVFDELPTGSLLRRDGSLDDAAYPGFARLARSATWYPNATAVQDTTLAAVPGILAGEPGDPDKPPSSRAYPETLLSTLAPTHSVRAFEQFSLCPPQECAEQRPAAFPARIADFLPYLRDAALDSFLPDEIAAKPPGANVFGRGDRLLGFDSLGQLERSPGESPFLFIHSYLPHTPWTLLPDGRRVADSGGCCLGDLHPGAGSALGGIGGIRLTGDQHVTGAAQQEHLSQVAYVDRLVGRLIARLQDAGLYDRALVVVTADHGVNFEPGELYRQLDAENAESVLGVPLFVKRPHQRRARVDPAHAQTIDVVPTVAAELGVGLPWDPDGRVLGTRGADRGVLSARSDVSGEELELDPAELDQERRRQARATDRLFGAAPGLQLWRFGPAPHLHGRPLPQGELPATVDNAAAFADVDPDAAQVPAEVSGTIPGAGAGDEVAIALDRRVVATTWVYDSAGTPRFRARIPPSALRRGRNDLAIGRVPARG